MPVTHGVTGSSPVRTASFVYCKRFTQLSEALFSYAAMVIEGCGLFPLSRVARRKTARTVRDMYARVKEEAAVGS